MTATAPGTPAFRSRNRYLAAFLAYLIPGLGHLYQGRTFKGLLYAVCILGTFFVGVRIGEGKVVYLDWHPERRTYAYMCQFWAGAPALPPLMHNHLRSKDGLEYNRLFQPLTSKFEGTLRNLAPGQNVPDLGNEVFVQGTVEFIPAEPLADAFHWDVKIQGTIQSKAGEFPLTGKLIRVLLDPQIAPGPQRYFEGELDGELKLPAPGLLSGKFTGAIPRPWWDSYGAPLQDRKFWGSDRPTDLERVHMELASRFELGVVYTMIAGLLNILAIYDALEGPAYETEDTPTPDIPPPPPKPA